MRLFMSNRMSIKTGIVNIQDLVLVASAIGSSAELNTEYNVDVNADGVVNVLDLVQVANDLGT